MKEATVTNNLSVIVQETSIPTPQPGQLLIRVVAAGLNPKDWKLPLFFLGNAPPSNQGDDISGYVEAVGEGVAGFKKGDRVATLHQMFTPHGGYAEYAIAWAYTTFHIPESTDFEEAATIPLAAATAALSLYQCLKLPLPWNPQTPETPLPLVVYGGSTAVGSFALKLAKLSNIHPLIVIAGKGSSYVETLIDPAKGDVIIDYRNKGTATIESEINVAAKGADIHHALDAVADNGTYNTIAATLAAPGRIAAVWPPKDDAKIPAGVVLEGVMVGSLHADPPATKIIEDREFGAAFFAFLGRGLAGGWFSGHPVEVKAGGLNGLEAALNDLKSGLASAVKYVVRIGETEGV
ncbi:hypothetical protein AbraIFM66951_001744 [Aspergillus brasiliensis]|uniref:Enoyl reductase (ER) domain-containing protein n=1 Tax=Aspergillus brasiliensis TaxID=319629 RepID=A0A9W5Z1M3_9EURO|nr:hypothetical protein AbraCBS73388_005169 [Aspergillus brasiliensis]GKZ49340.1 hypothetical protein AbraIFM66951_001744 [Aspergillus brasiliensis]